MRSVISRTTRAASAASGLAGVEQILVGQLEAVDVDEQQRVGGRSAIARAATAARTVRPSSWISSSRSAVAIKNVGPRSDRLVGADQRLVGEHLLGRDVDDRLERHPRTLERAVANRLSSVERSCVEGTTGRSRAPAHPRDAVAASRARDRGRERLVIERLREVRHRAESIARTAPSSDGSPVISSTGNVVIVEPDGIDQREAIELRHVDVGDDAIEIAVAQRVDGTTAIDGRGDRPAFGRSTR